MKLKVLTNCSDPYHPGFKRWKQSIDRFDYDYEVLNDPGFSWSAAYPTFLKWCKERAGDYTHILYTDCFDVVVLAPMKELLEKYLYHECGIFSTEKACFPNTNLSIFYPITPYPWQYINCGGSLFPIDLFIDVFERYNAQENIQDWSAKEFFNNSSLRLDTDCEIFQTVGFEAPDDFALTRDGRLLNRKTKTFPIFIHGNGRTRMDWLETIL